MVNVIFLIIYPPLRVSIRRFLTGPAKKQKPNDNNIFTVLGQAEKGNGEKGPKANHVPTMCSALCYLRKALFPFHR